MNKDMSGALRGVPAIGMSLKLLWRQRNLKVCRREFSLLADVFMLISVKSR